GPGRAGRHPPHRGSRRRRPSRPREPAERRRIRRRARRRRGMGTDGPSRIRSAGQRTARSVVVVLRRRGGIARHRVGRMGAAAMTVGVLAPRMLLLLFLVPLVLLAGRRGTVWAAALRALAAVALVLVLAGAYVQRARPSGGSCVVLAVDVSASVAHAGIDAAARMLPAIQHALRPQDVVGAVAFGGDARVLAPPSHEPLAPTALVAAAESAGLDPDASNLAGAPARPGRDAAGDPALQRRAGDARQRARRGVDDRAAGADLSRGPPGDGAAARHHPARPGPGARAGARHGADRGGGREPRARS